MPGARRMMTYVTFFSVTSIARDLVDRPDVGVLAAGLAPLATSLPISPSLRVAYFTYLPCRKYQNKFLLSTKQIMKVLTCSLGQGLLFIGS